MFSDLISSEKPDPTSSSFHFGGDEQAENSQLLQWTQSGWFCAPGGFHIDPIRKVPRAVITHAHGDHARPGMGSYLVSAEGEWLARARLPRSASIQTLPSGQPIIDHGVRVSLHPSGHMPGSVQVRMELGGRVAVFTSDFKRTTDPLSEPYEPLLCQDLVIESTFARPCFIWPPVSSIVSDILDWWRNNRAQGMNSILLTHALGKAQHLLAHLPHGEGNILLHPSIDWWLRLYRRQYPHTFPETFRGTREMAAKHPNGSLILVPPRLRKSSWVKKFAPSHVALLSGWVMDASDHRAFGPARGFPLSDHADWTALWQTVRESGAERIWTTHGFASEFASVLNDEGLKAWACPPD